MRRFALLGLVLLLAPFSACAEDKLLAHWVQLGPAGDAEVRAVVSGKECPWIFGFERTINAPRMKVRAAATVDFPLLCGEKIPKGVNDAWIESSGLKMPPKGAEDDPHRNDVVDDVHGNKMPRLVDVGWSFPLPKANPQRILVLGDTGCRIKGTLVQPCNDPAQWPFAQLAASAAKLKPDLVIHVGDYLYRETPCPDGNTGCAGTPYGDNWPSWDADFFTPAAPLLAAAPWVIVRGNHEDCARSGPGYLRLLGPGAYDASAPCADHVASYDIPLDGMTLTVMDTANAPDTSVDPSVVPVYQGEFAALASETQPTWLLMHRPIWAAVCQDVASLCMPAGGNATLIAALAGQPMPKPVELMLAGHIHAFEVANYKSGAPPTMLSGNGGDLLDTTPKNLKGTVFQGSSGVYVKDGMSIPGFGFLLMTKGEAGWRIDLYDAAGNIERVCNFAAGRVDCPPTPPPASPPK